MKKLLVVFLSILLLAGCSSAGKEKVKVCTLETTDYNNKPLSNTYKVFYKEDKVTKYSAESISYVDEAAIDFNIEYSNSIIEKWNSVEGMNFSYTKYSKNQMKSYNEVDFTKLDVKQAKAVLGDMFDIENSMFGNTDITVDKFIKSYLSEYTCKDE